MRQAFAHDAVSTMGADGDLRAPAPRSRSRWSLSRSSKAAVRADEAEHARRLARS